MADYGVQERPRPSRQENAQNEYAYHLQETKEPRRAPPELDPRTFDHRVGERENSRSAPQVADDPALSAARQAFAGFHERLTKIAEGESAVRADPTATDAAKLLQIADLHDAPSGTSPTARANEARSRVRESRHTAEGRIANALKGQMNEAEAREVRDRVAGMTAKQREELLQDIRQSGDVKLAAALTAPSSHIAAGLDRGTYKELRRFAENALAPEDAKRRDQLSRAEAELNAAEERYLSTVNSWQPDPNKVAEVRAKAEASRKARGQE
jgi:hypothetical protein